MEQDVLTVAVMEGDRVLLRAPCRRVPLPDGTFGVIWRGTIYPLHGGDQIQAGSPLPSGTSPPPGSERDPEPAPLSYRVASDAHGTALLVRGPPSVLRQVVASLRSGGIDVARTGRWLARMEGETAFDWVIHLAGDPSEPLIAEALQTKPAVQGATANVELLELHLAGLAVELAGLRGALEAARHSAARDARDNVSGGEETELRNQLAAALERVSALEAALNEALLERQAEAPGWQNELSDVLARLRPDLRLERDSLLIACSRFSARAAFYRGLGELPVRGGRPDHWKAVRGVRGWWERHVSNGQDDSGRLYARFDTLSMCWHVLLSTKAAQPLDMAWLRENG